jgi:hypothetical protein
VRTQTISRLHRLLCDLVPAGAGRNLTADGAEALLGQIAPAGAPAMIRWQLAGDLITDVRDLDRRIATVEARITAAVTQSKTSLVSARRSAALRGASPPQRLTYQPGSRHLHGSVPSGPGRLRGRRGSPPRPTTGTCAAC